MQLIRRLVLTAVSLMLFVSTLQICMAAVYAVPRLSIRAVWENNGFTVTWVRPAGLAWMDGVRPGARISKVYGSPPQRSDNIAKVHNIEVVDNGVTYATSTEMASPLMYAYFPPAFTVGVWFAGVGHLYFLVARHRTWGWLIFLVCVSGAYVLITLATLAGGTLLWAFDVVALGLLVFCSACLVFALGFPIDEYLTRPAGRRLVITSVASSTIIGLLYLYVVYHDVSHYDSFRPVLAASYLVNALGACLIEVRSLIQHRQVPHIVRTITWLGIGLGLGILPFCFLVVFPTIISGTPLLPPEQVIYSLIFFSLGLIVAAAQLEVYYTEERGAYDFMETTLWFLERRMQGKASKMPTDNPKAVEQWYRDQLDQFYRDKEQQQQRAALRQQQQQQAETARKQKKKSRKRSSR